MTIGTGDGMDEAVNPTNANQMYTASYYGRIARSDNGGNNWNGWYNPNDNGAWVAPFLLNPQNPSSLYAGYEDVWRTTDGGPNWTKISDLPNSTPLTVLHVAYADSNYIYAGRSGALWMTTNGGTNWASVTLPGSISLTRLESNPDDVQEIWITSSGYTSGNKVYHSTNAGGSWTNISDGLPNIPVNCIIYQKNYKNRLYAGTDLGVYYYDDDSNLEWVEFNEDLPNVIVNDLEIQTSTNSLFAGTYGRGLWKTEIPIASTGQPLAAPELINPSNHSTAISIVYTFEWNSVEDADTYELFISENSDFSTEFFRQSGLVDTTYNYSQLDYNTTYYWKVNSANSSETSDWSEEWDFITILEAPTLSLPTDASECIPLDDSFQWNAVDGASTYHLQVATDENFNTIINDLNNLTGTSQNFPLLDIFTQYFWRVSASNSNSTSIWSDVWNYTTKIAPTSLNTPTNQSTTVSVDCAFDWETEDNADTYELFISTSPDFSSEFFRQSGLTETSYTYSSLDYNTQYYWKISNSNTNCTSDWSETYNFITILEAPALSLPTDDMDCIPLDDNFQWNTVNGATTYHLQVATDEQFNAIISDIDNITSTTQTFNSLNNYTQYYWRVSASNANSSSNWSETRSFITKISDPELIYPSDNSEGRQLNLTLSWESVTGAETYDLMVSSNSNFSSTFLSVDDLAIPNNDCSGFDYSSNYYWKVKAHNSDCSSEWSNSFQFVTILPAPELNYPDDKSEDVGIIGKLIWNTVDSADSYSIQLASNKTFEDLVHDDDGITINESAYSNLKRSTKYYWRVNANNQGGTSDWSIVREFITMIAVPQPLTPEKNEYAVPVEGQCTWGNVIGATSYHFQISLNSTFTDPILDVDNIVSTEISYSDFAFFTKYYWRVRASNEKASTAWSKTQYFTTVMTSPLIKSPSNNYTEQPTNGKLIWHSVPGADSYSLQISRGESYLPVYIDVNNIEDTIFTQSTKIEPNTKYYWRVRAISSNSTSKWASRCFTTIEAAPRLFSPLNHTVNQATADILSLHHFY